MIVFKDLRPIKRLDIKHINVMLCVKEKTDKHNSMEIIFPEEKEKTGRQMVSRSIFVHSETSRVCKFSHVGFLFKEGTHISIYSVAIEVQFVSFLLFVFSTYLLLTIFLVKM